MCDVYREACFSKKTKHTHTKGAKDGFSTTNRTKDGFATTSRAKDGFATTSRAKDGLATTSRAQGLIYFFPIVIKA